MNAARALLGIYVPGTTSWHRMGVGRKYLVFLALTLPVMIVRDPWLATGLLALTLALVATTRAPLRLAWGLPPMLILLLGVLAGYQVFFGDPRLAVTVTATILIALYAGRILLLTTPMPVLIDALVAAAGPFRFLGARPERFGLAIAVLIRSIPFVAASFGEVRDATRARGIDRNPLLAVTPVVIQAVAFARTTGDALVARGLGEDDE
ncbi:MAG: energy-coupling factor transporter transmembrane protein EcfT [Propioniciclava sp.]|uniref:energy-coupling factor transporter transmembrane protein EcfT n=1 Tax=Propioniciclava sp. TaxID=2038686 RepID=UPI0039E425FE